MQYQNAERPLRDPTLAIVGNPNVGKSVVFGNLTGRYATVSNYPGTTVEVSRGEARLGGRRFEVVDTPGMYSLSPISGEESVARELVLDGPDALVHVVDAKNLERMLPLTFQLAELGLPVVLLLNMLDEAERVGLAVDAAALERELSVPVVGAIATRGLGMDALRAAVTAPAPRAPGPAPVRYPPALEAAAQAVEAKLARPGARGLALLLLQGDPELEAGLDDGVKDTLWAQRELLAGQGVDPAFAVAVARADAAQALAARCAPQRRTPGRGLAERLSDLTVSPWTGVPILLAVLYLGLYRFVGTFGAGTLVDLLEHNLFGEHVVPRVNTLLAWALPGAGWRYWARELVGGEYGLVTLGVTYAVAIVLPIVCLFFLFFSLLEDSGYFPRLAMLVDRLFKRLGLNGRAVIPIVLGFGCATMATMVTRIQETKRERFITTLLLALAIPCSAQYGVITALLAAQPARFFGMSKAFLVWGGIMAAVFVGAGSLASRLVPGEAASFHMELPPLRLPTLRNVLMKTLARMKWYFMEVLPLFLLASGLIWIGRLTGAFDAIVRALVPAVRVLGLPPEAAKAFLFGFFRRDFGAAGLYDLARSGRLSEAQVLVACVTLTLFLPCVAQLLIMKRERGGKAAFAMAVGVVAVAFAAGATLHAVLSTTGFSS